MGLLAVCILAYALPVHAEKESVSLEAKDNEATVSLQLPQAGISDNMTAQYDEIHSLQLGMRVEPITGNGQDHVSFEFDKGITSDVKDYRYQPETGTLNIYISGQQDLFANEELAIGKVILDSRAGEGTSVRVRTVEESLYTVNGAYYMQEKNVDMPNPVELEIKAKATPVVKKEQKPKVSPSTLTFTVGDKAQTLKVTNAKGSVKYSVDNKKAVSVTSKGKVTPKAAGKATITITASGNKTYKQKTLKVKVTVRPKRPLKVSNVKVTPTKKKGKMKVTWKKVTASGYQIRYGSEGTLKQYSVITVPKGTAKTKAIKKVKSGRRAYVQVRAYKTKGGVTAYGKWSKMAVSSGKIK